MTDKIYEISGTIYQTVSQTYETLRGGSPTKYPRQASVFASSSTEIYAGARFRDLRQRQALNRTQLDITASDSWTQHRGVGSSQAFVIQPISASRHEVYSRGCFFSGTEAYTSGPVPASRSMFYEKPRTLNKSVYRWVASSSMNGFAAGLGVLIASTASMEMPHYFNIDVPDSGRIVDVRVWVEIHQPSGSAGSNPPLGQLGIALQAPNVRFPHAHPIRSFKGDNTSAIYEEVTAGHFHEGTYLLWEAPGLYRSFSVTPYTDGAGEHTPSVDPAMRNPVWDRDRSMRTIFSDGASTPNPRDLMQIYRGGGGVQSNVIGMNAPSGDQQNGTGNALGAGVCWTGSNATGVPPRGWLTGHAFDWPTEGANLGPHVIRPVYPILDDIYVKKLYHTSSIEPGGPGLPPTYYFANWQKWVGSRPGLRGSEMNGRWQLRVSVTDRSGSLSYANTYLRQWRLEITYKQEPTGTGRAIVTPHRGVRRPGSIPFRPGRQLIGVFSGSKGLTSTLPAIAGVPSDFSLSGIYADFGFAPADGTGEYFPGKGLTVGVTHSTSSLEYLQGDFAVYTGSVSLTVNTSSYSRSDVIRVLDPDTLLAGPKTLPAVVRAAGLRQTTEQVARRILSGTL